MMNILYICSDSGIPVLGRKGASVHVRSLVSAFAAAGHAVVLATPLLNKSPWETPASIDASVMHVPASEAIVAAVEEVRSYNEALEATNTVPSELRRILYDQHLKAKLLRRFQHAPPDFIYERAALFGTTGVTLARALNVPVIVELNAPLGIEQSTYRGSYLPALAAQAERCTLLGADVVVTVSSPLREYVIGLGVPAERILVMPNGVNPEVFSPQCPSAAVRERWGLGPGPVIGFVGGLRPWHGVRALPALLHRLAARHAGVQMLIAGDGPLRDELTTAFRQNGTSDRVCFTGPVSHEEVADLIRLFDVALAPYDETSHLFYFSPLKLFEYMGCGVPVVAAAIGQIPDVVHDQENGLLYAPGDLDGLSTACDRLLGDAALRTRLGRAAVQLVHGRFTWAHNAARVVDVARTLACQEEVLA
jgi:glycosyltransferase involved in cell wall biosynthesis